MKIIAIILALLSLALFTSCTRYEHRTVFEVTYSGGVEKDTIEEILIDVFTPKYQLDEGCLERMEGIDEGVSVVCDIRSYRVLSYDKTPLE